MNLSDQIPEFNQSQINEIQKKYRLLCAAINRIKAEEDKRSDYRYSLEEVCKLMSSLNACYVNITDLLSFYSQLQYQLSIQELNIE